MEKKKIRKIDEEGRLRNLNGDLQYMLDFIATKDFIPRYYDYTTKNTTFLNMHVFLKKCGVKNHNEHLQIFDKDLIGVDPHSETLTDAIREKIANECRINPWYYFREVHRVLNNGTAVELRLGLESYSALFFMMRARDILMEAPRQVGKTVSVTSMLCWLLNFGANGYKMANIHYKEEEASKNLNQVNDMLDLLPKYLQFHNKTVSVKTDGKVDIRQRARSADKKTKLVCEIFENTIDNILVGTSPDNADRTGRGRTLPVVFIDEIAHIKYNKIALAALNPAMATAGENAIKNGKIRGLWMLCTPGDLKTDEGKFIQTMINNEYFCFSYKHFKMFDMVMEELDEYIYLNSKNPTIFLSWEYHQLGLSNKWLNDRVSKMPSLDSKRREFLLKWEVSTASSPFSEITLSDLETKTMVMDKKQITYELDGYGNKITIYPRGDELFNDFQSFLFSYKDGIVIGIDCAFGAGGEADKTTMVGMDPKTLNVIFTYGRNDISMDDFSMLVINIIQEYIAPMGINLALAIERNADGRTLIGILKKYNDFAKYLVVYPTSNERLNNPLTVSDYQFTYNGVSTKFDIGLYVSSSNRTELMNLLIKLVTKHTSCVAVRPITHEISTLIVKKSVGKAERIEHSLGNHDDFVFALIHAAYAIYYNGPLLKTRNAITVTPDSFILNKNSTTVNTTGIVDKRVKIIYVSENGRMVEKYWDNHENKYIDLETAEKLIEEDRHRTLLGITKEDIKYESESEMKKQEVVDFMKNYIPEGGEAAQFIINGDSINTDNQDDYEDEYDDYYNETYTTYNTYW